MLVVTFAVDGPGNCAVVDGLPYVYARTALGSFVLPARCPHRGGPLHLGRLDADRQRLVCPWHGRAAPLRRCLTRGIPAVRRDGVVTAVLPHERDATWHVERRPLSPALCGSAPAPSGTTS